MPLAYFAREGALHLLRYDCTPLEKAEVAGWRQAPASVLRGQILAVLPGDASGGGCLARVARLTFTRRGALMSMDLEPLAPGGAQQVGLGGPCAWARGTVLPQLGQNFRFAPVGPAPVAASTVSLCRLSKFQTVQAPGVAYDMSTEQALNLNPPETGRWWDAVLELQEARSGAPLSAENLKRLVAMRRQAADHALDLATQVRVPAATSVQ